VKWNKVKTIISFTFSDNIRMKRTFALIALFILLFVTSMRFTAITFIRQALRTPHLRKAPDFSLLFFQNLLSNLALLLPFIGVMFGYDVVSGERERGTLRIILVQPIYRDEFLLGKFLGSLITMIFIITVSMSISTGISAALYGIVLNTSILWKFLLVILISTLYSTAWYAISLLVSIFSRRTSISALISIAIALIVIVIAPIIVTTYVMMTNPPPIFTGSESPQSRQSMIREWAMKVQRIQAQLTSFLPDTQFRRLIRSIVIVKNDLALSELILETSKAMLQSALSLTYIILLAILPLIASFIVFIKQELK